MKKLIIKALFLLFAVQISTAQAWMTSLDLAQKLASVQNKMVLMVWEETTLYPYPVYVNDDEGNTIFIENLYEDENVSPLIWENFIPVIVSDSQYADLYLKIKDKRNRNYIDKFNDNSIKIMDINGNILNVSNTYEELQNITTLIQNYALNTEFITPELLGYQQEANFYSAYFLASKYLDFSIYSNETLRPELIGLSTIYLDEAREFIETHPKEEQLALSQRIELLTIEEQLIAKRAKKVLRLLKRMNAENVEANNEPVVAFLYYTAYLILKDETKAAVWKSKISSVNLKKAKLIINLNS